MLAVLLLASDWLNVVQVRINAVAPGSSIFSSTASANYGEELAPFELAKPGVPAKRLGTTFEVKVSWVVWVVQVRYAVCSHCCSWRVKFRLH